MNKYIERDRRADCVTRTPPGRARRPREWMLTRLVVLSRVSPSHRSRRPVGQSRLSVGVFFIQLKHRLATK